MTVGVDAPRAWRSTMALESSERGHAAGILADARARDPEARRFFTEVDAATTSTAIAAGATQSTTRQNGGHHRVFATN